MSTGLRMRAKRRRASMRRRRKWAAKRRMGRVIVMQETQGTQGTQETPSAPVTRTRTRVKALTKSNVHAIQKCELAVETGATFAVFEGSPGEVLRRVRAAISETGDLSLHAVRRKLENEEARFVVVEEVAG